MTFDTGLITAIIGALGGFLTAALTAYITYRRAMTKMQTEIEETRVRHKKELMDAQAEFKRRTDESDSQRQMIAAIIKQGDGAQAIAESVQRIALAIDENTKATNRLSDKVEDSKKETKKLDIDIDNFAAHLIRATSIMEDARDEIQATAGLIGTTGKETQANSAQLASAIIEKLNELKKLSEDTLGIVRDIDQRVKALETKPDPIPPPPAIPALVVIKDTPAPARPEAVVIPTEVKAQDAPEEKQSGQTN